MFAGCCFSLLLLLLSASFVIFARSVSPSSSSASPSLLFDENRWHSPPPRAGNETRGAASKRVRCPAQLARSRRTTRHLRTERQPGSSELGLISTGRTCATFLAKLDRALNTALCPRGKSSPAFASLSSLAARARAQRHLAKLWGAQSTQRHTRRVWRRLADWRSRLRRNGCDSHCGAGHCPSFLFVTLCTWPLTAYVCLRRLSSNWRRPGGVSKTHRAQANHHLLDLGVQCVQKAELIFYLV